MREFTSGTAGKPVESKTFRFKLDKVEFTTVVRSDADSVLEWSEITDAAMQSDADMESPAGTAIVSKFFRLFMAEGEYKRMRRHMREHGTPAEVLEEIMQALNEEMDKLVSEDTGRPTQPSSSSSAGRTDQDDRTLRIASLGEDGDVEFAARPNRQARRAADRRQAQAVKQTG